MVCENPKVMATPWEESEKFKLLTPGIFNTVLGLNVEGIAIDGNSGQFLKLLETTFI